MLNLPKDNTVTLEKHLYLNKTKTQYIDPVR